MEINIMLSIYQIKTYLHFIFIYFFIFFAECDRHPAALCCHRRVNPPAAGQDSEGVCWGRPLVLHCPAAHGHTPAARALNGSPHRSYHSRWVVRIMPSYLFVILNFLYAMDFYIIHGLILCLLPTLKIGPKFIRYSCIQFTAHRAQYIYDCFLLDIYNTLK